MKFLTLVVGGNGNESNDFDNAHDGASCFPTWNEDPWVVWYKSMGCWVTYIIFWGISMDLCCKRAWRLMSEPQRAFPILGITNIYKLGKSTTTSQPPQKELKPSTWKLFNGPPPENSQKKQRFREILDTSALCFVVGWLDFQHEKNSGDLKGPFGNPTSLGPKLLGFQLRFSGPKLGL